MPLIILMLIQVMTFSEGFRLGVAIGVAFLGRKGFVAEKRTDYLVNWSASSGYAARTTLQDIDK